MKTNVLRRASVLGGCAWLGTAAYGITTAITESGDNWSVGYTLFTFALLIGAVSTLLIVAAVSHQANRPRLRMAGLVVIGVGCAAAVVAAWALPVWMTLLGAGFALVGIAAGSVRGRLPAVLAAGQLVAIAVLIAGIEAEVGRRDEWGDYPAAVGIALVFAAAVTVAGIATLARSADGFGDLSSPSHAAVPSL